MWYNVLVLTVGYRTKKGYRKHPIEYAVYDYEDNLLMVGSIREISEFTGMTPGSIHCTRTVRGEERGNFIHLLNWKMKNKKDYVDQNMVEVIETSRSVRNFLVDLENWDSNKKYLEAFKQTIQANRNIVSASLVLLHTEKMK